MKAEFPFFAPWTSVKYQCCSAAEMSDGDEVHSQAYQAISEMPRPNRDTIAFVVLHLQRWAQFFLALAGCSFG